jgi:prepilin-type N-terminal cleavage/methylation domain-containing protein
MTLRIRSRSGFTLLELLVVISIIAIVAVALYPVFGRFRRKAKVMQAQKTMDVIKMAMDKYKEDFSTYPPDDTPSANGSEMIWYYLGRVHKSGEMHFGPYMQIAADQLKDSDSGSNKKFVSPLGGEYKYAQLIDADGAKRTYILVDPGEDLDFGGSVDVKKGFVQEDETKAKDNISSMVQVQPASK